MIKRILGDMIFCESSLSSIPHGSEFLKISSDGSMKHNEGTLAWSIWNDNEKLISSQLPVDRNKIDSYRAELTRIRGSLSFFWLMQQSNILHLNYIVTVNQLSKLLIKIKEIHHHHMTK